MASPLPSLHPSNDDYLNIELPSENEAPPSPPPETQFSGPQSLILRLGPHPTQVSSSINASNQPPSSDGFQQPPSVGGR
ncbi:hypothetical protein PCANC_23927 [Puccinia coronata f. sp. avenae]|uniref:Uncharacterized protein n=1 Tax=Puccinia coronata f. sp. avenae TaxID=200324 RepID=A0A2N5TXA2_9BASI|nr:hypothetical protein PCANC_23927 [Puccinia coronata f. sp. avenae]